MGKLMKVNYLGGKFFRGNLEYDKRIDNYNDEGRKKQKEDEQVRLKNKKVMKSMENWTHGMALMIVFEFIKLHN